MSKEKKTKYMKIEAYRIMAYLKDDVELKNGKLISFDELDKKFQSLKAEDKIKLDLGLYSHQLTSIYEKDNYYELIFSKLDATDYPLIFDDDGQISDMKDNIGSDKRIGHITCGIYNKIYNVLLLQINFNSMNPRQIENYLTEKIAEENIKIKLEPLIDKNYYEKLSKGHITKFDISMHINEIDLPRKNTPFYAQYRAGKQINAINTSFVFSMGRVKKETLNEDVADEMLDDISDNIGIISKAKVSYKEQMDSKVEIIDLLLQKLNSKVYFEIEERATLREYAIIEKIVENYNSVFSKKLANYFIDQKRR